MRFFAFGAFVLVSALCGCGFGYNPAVGVRRKAAFDLGCPSDQIQVYRLTQSSYGATGCGKRASYELATGCYTEQGCRIARTR